MADVTDRLHLLLGDDEFLVERATSSIRAEVNAETGTDVPITRVRAGDVSEYELAEMLSPSLFADERIVIVESAADAGKEPAALITSAARSLPEGITLLVAHTGGGRTKSMVGALKSAGAQVHECAALKWPEERVRFVKAEFARLKVRVSAEVVAQVVESVGADLRELAAACSQLVSDTGGKVDAAAIATYYSGRPETKGFDVADRAITGDKAGALETLSWAEHHGVPHVVIADALGEAVHAIARVKGLGTMDQYSAASEVGMSPGRLKRVQSQARAWNAESIASALMVVSTLNGDVKGQAADADYSLQRAVGLVADLKPTRHR